MKKKHILAALVSIGLLAMGAISFAEGIEPQDCWNAVPSESAVMPDEVKPAKTDGVLPTLILKVNPTKLGTYSSTTFSGLLRKERALYQEELSRHVGVKWNYQESRSGKYLIVNLPRGMAQEKILEIAEKISSFQVVDFAEADRVILAY